MSSSLLSRISENEYYEEDDDDDEDIEAYSQDEWEDIARQIRSLSTTVWLTGEHYTVSARRRTTCIDLLEVYRSWATLLTRDSQSESVVAVTGDGSTIDDATRVIAILPYREDSVDFMLSPESYTGADYYMLHRQPIELRPDSCFVWPDNLVSAESHARCLLNIVSSLAEQPDGLFLYEDTQRQSALRFIYAQCWPEVLACAKGANHLPQATKTWHDLGLLARYKPHPAELNAKSYERVPSRAAAMFAGKGLEQRDDDDDTMITDDQENGAWFVFCPETARIWFSILCDAVYGVLYHCQRVTEAGNSEDRPAPAVMEGVVSSMSDLYMLSEVNAMQRLLNFPSLIRYLDMNCPDINQEICPQLSSVRRSTRTFSRSDYKVLEEWREGRNIVGRMRRHISDLLAWHTALITLVHATSLCANPMTLELVPYRRPSPQWREKLMMQNLTSVLEMDPPGQSVKYNEVWRYVKGGLPEDLDAEGEYHLGLEIDERAKILDLPKAEDDPPKWKPLHFPDNVHTEALLMDFLAQGEHVYRSNFDAYVLSRTAPGLLTFVDSRRTFNRLIGIPLQYDMCYCCCLLERRLLHGMTELHSTIPGPIVPWTPPLLCHNDEALESVQGALFQTVADIIRTLEDDARASTPTATSQYGSVAE